MKRFIFRRDESVLIFKILSFLFRSNDLNLILVWYNKKMEKFIKKLEFDEAAIQLFEALGKENSKRFRG